MALYLDNTIATDVQVSTFKTGLKLDNVDNTKDVNKPVSTLQQQAIDAVKSQLSGGVLSAGVWVKLPAIYKLLIDGVGTVTLDVRNTDGSVSRYAKVYDPSVKKIVYPYFGLSAYEVKATFTGTAIAEIR